MLHIRNAPMYRPISSVRFAKYGGYIIKVFKVMWHAGVNFYVSYFFVLTVKTVKSVIRYTFTEVIAKLKQGTVFGPLCTCLHKAAACPNSGCRNTYMYRPTRLYHTVLVTLTACSKHICNNIQ